MKFKTLFKKITYTKINYIRLLACMFMSFLICIVLYMTSHIRYTNISDFYVGASLFLNYNKIFDKLLPYIYFSIALCLYIINYGNIFHFFRKISAIPNSLIEKIYTKKLSTKWIIFAIALIFMVNYHPYNPTISADNYHFGEKLMGSYLDTNNLELYKDYFPAHGLSDIIPSWIGIHIYKDTTVNGVLFGEYVYNYLIMLIAALLTFVAFPSVFGFLCCILFNITDCNVTAIYFLTMYILLTNKYLEKHIYIYSIILSVSSFLLYVLIPTFGAPFVLTMLIPYLFRFILYCKKSSKQQILFYIILFLLFNGIITFIFRNFLFNNFAFILLNFKTNLLSFGNLGSFNLFNLTIYCAQYMLLPFFFLMLADELSKNKKDINTIMLLIALIVYPFFISKYSLGRLDYALLLRARIISYPILIFLLPVLLNKEKFKKIKKIYIVIMVVLSMSAPISFIAGFDKNFKTSNNFIVQKTNFNNGRAIFKNEHLRDLNSILSLIQNNISKKDYTFFDLTNQGALYFYLNKKPLLPYIAYFNIPSPEQDKIYSDKLKNNLPDIILINSGNKPIDNLPPSLRINNIFKTILLSKRYIVLNNEKYTILKKVDFHQFSEDEIKKLEDAFSFSELKSLPDVYGSSMKTLNKHIKKLDLDFDIKKEHNHFIITFKKPITGSVADFMYLETGLKNLTFNILINNSDVVVETRKHKRLIPININPNVLLKNIDKIEIYPDKEIESIDNIAFYRKKEN